jgi:hypothetical protein
MSDPVADFIAGHLDADLHKLLLSANKYPGIPIPYVVAQIEALRKVRYKIPAWYSPQLHFPPQISVEQSSSAATALFKANLCTGNRMADLTGGMGVDSYYWAKSFQSVDYVEQNETLTAAAQHNFAVLGAHNIHIHHSSAEDFLVHNTSRYDLLYADPARRDTHNNKVFLLSDCQPDVVQLRDTLLAHADQVLIKTAPMLDISLAMKQLGKVKKVWVVAVENECKEVLYLLDNEGNSSNDTIQINAVVLDSPTPSFSFTRQEEENAPERLAMPQQYLYEPNVAVMKAGAFRLFGHRFGLAKLHPNTQLFTSETLEPQAPGRIFAIRAVVKYDYAAVREALPGNKANIAVRNFPDPVATVRKRLKLADGGDWYLFAVTVMDGSKRVVICEKV